MTTFRVHTGVQNTTVAELRELWAGAEELGFDTVSVWDHLYSSDLASYECHEAVSMHAALACATTRVRCGCLVYCAGYRHPGILAKAVTTIDHLSGGRRDRPRRRLGAGRVRRFGIRSRRSAAGSTCWTSAGAVRSLLRDALDHARGRPRAPGRRPQRTPPGAGRPAHLDRRSRRAAHRPHRRPPRRRLEPALRGAW